MNILAEELNNTLSDSVAYGFLSPVGRRMYFPKGIVAQSDEAKEFLSSGYLLPVQGRSIEAC